jgi:hypothetical protein
MTIKLLLYSLFSLSILISGAVKAQIIYESGTPVSWKVFKSATAQLPVETLPSFDLATLIAEDAVNDVEKMGPWRFGKAFETSYNTENSGIWHELENGEQFWRLAIRSKDALSMNVIFDEYILVPGDQVFIYSEDRSDVIGPFTHQNNKDWKGLATLPVSGETIIIELIRTNADSDKKSKLSIGQVTHGYRDIFGYAKGIYEKGLGDSGPCNNNVICAEGDPWRCEISSVAIIIVGGSGACTGSVLNNHLQDERPLFLSANHCGTNVTNWVFRFNWDSPTCTPTANGPTNQTVSGAALLANSGGSDFSLMELSSPIPASYNVYYSGWDATGNFPTNQTGIHHPSGDVKKISFDTDAAVHGTMAGAPCWQILTWEDGTTEPGSSGSGLWDQDHHLIGQLFGGTASCGNNIDDFYGRLDISWDGGGSPTSRLKDHLDPNTTGVKLLDGLGTGSCAGIIYDYDASISSINGIDASYCNASSITPTVTLKNSGNVTLTSVDINYDFNSGATTGTIPWTGSLAYGATEVVTLPNFTLSSGANTLTVTSDQPNGNSDMSVSNDSKTSNFSVIMNGVMVSIDIIIDDYGSETTWEINDGAGNILYTGGPYSDGNDGTLESTVVCLGMDECYNFVIYDSYGDGICCSYGNGSYTVSYNGSVYASGGTFNDEETTNFCVTLGLIENDLSGVRLYPNPTTGVITVDLSKTELINASLKVTNTLGKIVAQRQISKAISQIDLSKEANGLYLVEIVTEGGKLVHKLTLNN